jgi:hypothetical protein
MEHTDGSGCKFYMYKVTNWWAPTYKHMFVPADLNPPLETILTQRASLNLQELQEALRAGGSPNNNKKKRKTREEEKKWRLRCYLDQSLVWKLGGRKWTAKPIRKTMTSILKRKMTKKTAMTMAKTIQKPKTTTTPFISLYSHQTTNESNNKHQ